MTETTVGREIVQIVEIRQPLCANVYGSAPCTASGAAALKCYNTRRTCQDPENFALGDPVSLFFTRGNPADRGIVGVDYARPLLLSVSTSPAQINISGANPDAQGIGQRAVLQITFQDAPDTDRIVDPYLSDRTGNALDKSTFWTKWSYRNRFRQNIQCLIYEGYAGQTLAQMTKRRYFLTKFSGPDSSGRFSVEAKDILARLEDRKAQAPALSGGTLYSALSSSATSFLVRNAQASEYEAAGTVRIDDEVMTYGSVAQSGDNLWFSDVIRGTDRTTAATHEAETTVQRCLRYEAAQLDLVMADLLTTFGRINSSWLDASGWATEVSTFMPFAQLTTLITEPTGVAQLVSEIQVQSGCMMWWDERDSTIRLRAVRGQESLPDLLTDEANIIAGSVSVTELPRERISQVWVYYDQDNFTGSATEPDNYARTHIRVDRGSEASEEHGEASIRDVFGRWISNELQARSIARKIGRLYRDNPMSIMFQLDAKDRTYWLGDVVRIQHYKDVDAFGDPQIQYWQIISAEEVVPGEIVQYEARNTVISTQFSYIMATGSADYPTAVPEKNCYIGNAAGLLSDGEPAGRIA